MRLASSFRGVGRVGGARLAAATWAAVILLCGLLLATGVHVAGLSLARVTSGSMAPTIQTGDIILVRALSHPAAREVRRGDVVVFSFPLGSDKRAIKRVAGVPGDRLATHDQWLWVGGRMVRLLETPGVNGAQPLPPAVPPDTVFLLGDNVNASIDSRHFGSAPLSEIFGVVLIHAPAWAIWLAMAVLAAIALLTASRSKDAPSIA